MVDRPERNLRTTGADLDDVRNDGSIRWVPSGTWHHACSTAEAPGGMSADRHMDSRGCRNIHSGSVPGHTSILVSDAVQVRHARSAHPVAASEACSSQCRFAMLVRHIQLPRVRHALLNAGSQCRFAVRVSTCRNPVTEEDQPHVPCASAPRHRATTEPKPD